MHLSEGYDLSSNQTYLDSQESLAAVEAAQSCRKCVESVAFLGHPAGFAPQGHRHTFLGFRKGDGGRESPGTV